MPLFLTGDDACFQAVPAEAPAPMPMPAAPVAATRQHYSINKLIMYDAIARAGQLPFSYDAFVFDW